MGLSKFIVVIVAALSLAMPLMLLAVGVAMSPLWIAGALDDRDNSRMFVLCTLGGCLGILALYQTLRYWLSADRSQRLNWIRMLSFIAAGLTSLWFMFTRGFSALPSGRVVVVYLVVPTLCAALLLFLAAKKARSCSVNSGSPPNNALQRTCEDARG
jgi:uncharacterized membrane protein